MPCSSVFDWILFCYQIILNRRQSAFFALSVILVKRSVFEASYTGTQHIFHIIMFLRGFLNLN